MLASGSMELLRAYAWPGNVRELENLVERELIQSQVRGDEQLLTFRNLSTGQNAPLKKQHIDRSEAIHSLDDVVAEYIKHVLTHTRGKVEGGGGAEELLRVLVVKVPRPTETTRLL